MNTRSLMPALSLAVLLGASTAVIAQDNAKPKSADTSTAISDAAITTKVKAKFLGDSRLKGSDISVATANGVVSLTGTAPSSDSKKAAEEITRQVEGVKNVDNLLKAPGLADTIGHDAKEAVDKTERATSDSWITTKVKSSLLADRLTKGLKISVNTSNAVVVLSGPVSSQAEADRAVEIAKSIKGVQSVEAAGLRIGSN